MEKLKYAAKRLKEYKSGIGAVNEYDVVRAIVDVCKEEIPEWTFSAEIAKPQPIQGYTAEQWQEIKEGRYLCEFSGRNESRIEFLHYVGADELFQASDFSEWPNCRPAQIKGVMRPIFVEPVDEASMLCFFDGDGFPLNNRLSRLSWSAYEDSGDFYDRATKYIEL